ncbi:MAG: hypothetical protein JSR53_07250 [Proteobacteria bacterium]|nr:hypothetical protein [Pseudomonadota bacterium]
MRAPSHAPAVRYPLGRSPALAWLLAALAACSLAGLLAWLALGTAPASLSIKAATGLGLWLMAAALAWRWWHRMPVGQLCWDGGQWRLEYPAPGCEHAVQGSPRVHLDLQSGMLLLLAPMAQGRGLWLWLERRSDPAQWLALRRAVYSPARSQAPDSTSITQTRSDDRAPTQT